MKKTIVTPLVIAVVASFACVSAMAQVTVFSQNFESGLSSSESISGYNFGDSLSYTKGIVAGIGTGGSFGVELVNNTGGTLGYAGAAIQLQERALTLNTSANLSDYTLSFDARATAGSLNIQIQSWPLANFGGAMTGTLNTAPASPGYGNDQSLSSTYTHYSLNLGNATVFANPGTFLPTGATWQIAFQLNGGSNGNPPQLTMDIDNISLVMVPEPATFALAGLGIAALLVFRRRS